MDLIRPMSTRAFTLIETVVALAILGLVLTSMISLLAQEAVFDRRMDAQLQAQRSLESIHEAIRSGMALPLATPGVHEIEPILEPDLVSDFKIQATIEPLEPNGLYSVTLRASYRLGRQPFTRVLELRVWRP